MQQKDAEKMQRKNALPLREIINAGRLGGEPATFPRTDCPPHCLFNCQAKVSMSKGSISDAGIA
jgi:hypothetical protein